MHEHSSWLPRLCSHFSRVSVPSSVAEKLPPMTAEASFIDSKMRYRTYQSFGLLIELNPHRTCAF